MSELNVTRRAMLYNSIACLVIKTRGFVLMGLIPVKYKFYS